MISEGYIWNNYLPSQYLWDGTCGYHAINNTMNILHIINKHHLLSKTNNNFNQLLTEYKQNNINFITHHLRNYFIYLNSGKKSTTIRDLKNINHIFNGYNKLYFWNLYEDKIKIKSLIDNKINGTFGIIIYHKEWWVKHWYGLIVDIVNQNIYIHLLDSFNIIFPYKNELNNILKEINLSVNWHNNYNRLMIYGYKTYQSCLFIIVYFIIIYGLLYVLIDK
jgi:hypothetical protein